MRRLPPRLSKRTLRNHALALNALHMGCPVVDEVVRSPVMEQPSKREGRRGRQPESLVNDAVKDWARLKNGVLYRNRRGMVDLASGRKMPIGLGPNGTGDVVGYLPVLITPEMLGRTIAVYTMIESKVRGNPEPHQQACIDEVRAAGGISGVARNAQDAEDVLTRWRQERVRG